MQHPIHSNLGHIPPETVSQPELCQLLLGVVWRTAATRAYFEENSNHIREEKKLFGKGKHVAKMLVTASRSQFGSLKLFFALTKSILWPRKPSSASVTPPIWSSQDSFQFDGIKLWHRQDVYQRLFFLKEGEKCVICHFPFRAGPSTAMEKRDRIGKMENHYVKEGYMPKAQSSEPPQLIPKPSSK